MNKLSQKQIKALMRLVVEAENESTTQSEAAEYEQIHNILSTMLENISATIEPCQEGQHKFDGLYCEKCGTILF